LSMLNSLSFVMCGRSMMEGLISSRWMVAMFWYSGQSR